MKPEEQQQQVNRVFNVGDKVNFKGDFMPWREWTVEEFDKGFAVLKTENTEGLETNMKVVHLADIVPAVPQQQVVPLASEESPVKFSPVFNIVTGDGNKIEASPQNKPTQIQEPTSQEEQLSNDDDIFSRPLIKKSSAADQAAASMDSSISSSKMLSSGGAIVIKKLS